jgi:drug/metabolite transporter (DMT)-like permease
MLTEFLVIGTFIVIIGIIFVILYYSLLFIGALCYGLYTIIRKHIK